jgi:DNA-binding NarL/FixJ family response regulator
LFEDDPGRGVEIEKALKRAVGAEFRIERFEAPDTDEAGTYEDRLREALKGKRADSLTIIVTDRDLSALKNYRGLSEATVSKVAADLSVPVCVYAAGKDDSLLERHRSGGGGKILLDSSDPGTMARRVRVLAHGFRQLREVVARITKSKKMRQKYHGPATVLAEMLEAPEVVDQLSLYTRGDQRMISGLTPVQSRPGKVSQSPEDVRSIALALGVWLYDSILRFPGVILGWTAAASFLEIEPSAMKDAAVRRTFAKAQYKGPFSDTEEPRWWRHRLVELLKSKDVPDGGALVKKVTGKRPKPCLCSVDNKAPAGFLCVMTEKPVCDAHSVAQVGWLPRGADLARVRRDYYDEIGPWVGMS